MIIPEKVKKEIESLQNNPTKPIENTSFTPQYVGMKPKLSSKKIKERIFERFHKEEYEQLKQDLITYQLEEQDLINFFSKEGYPILSWAIGTSQDFKPLSFLCNDLPDSVVEVLKEKLNEKNFSIVLPFIVGQKGLENFGFLSEERKKFQIEKFKLLLKLDASGIIKFMETAPQKYLSDSISQSFLAARKEQQKIQPS